MNWELYKWTSLFFETNFGKKLLKGPTLTLNVCDVFCDTSKSGSTLNVGCPSSFDPKRERDVVKSRT